jgi:mannose-6-phosphate isomerase
LSLTALRDYFVAIVLPFWATAAFDEEAGQFMEGLQPDGSPDPSGIVRIRTAARQIYVFAHASLLGVAPEGALAKAERGFANLRKAAWIDGDKPGFARAIHYPTATVTDPERDLYDHTCVLLALAWLFKATGKREYSSHIEETIAAMDITFAAPHGGWAEDSIGSLPRRQNPHMHYFEACLALWETGCGERYAARAEELFGLFLARFFDHAAGILYENFGPAWQVADSYKSDRFEAGHMAEWVWLVHRYQSLSGGSYTGIAANLLDGALRIGKDADSVFLVDEATIDGRPLKKSRRLWPQAELLKAYVVQGRAAEADALIDALFDTYLAKTPAGTWRDCFDLDGRSIAPSVPASSLYHLWSAVAELIVRQDGVR